jgi:hypothetical protein
VLPARTKAGGVAVVALGLDAQRPEDARFLGVARKAAEFHETKLLALALGETSFEKDLEDALRAARPRSVLFVVPPRLLDVNLHRRVLLVSTRLDADVFPDFTFGWLTARDGASLDALWKRTQELRKNGLSSKRLVQSFVMGKAQSTVYEATASTSTSRPASRPAGSGSAASRATPRCSTSSTSTSPTSSAPA